MFIDDLKEMTEKLQLKDLLKLCDKRLLAESDVIEGYQRII